MATLELAFENAPNQATDFLPGQSPTSLTQRYESNVRDLNVAPGDLIYAVTDIGIAWNGAGYDGARDANDIYYVGKVKRITQSPTFCPTCTVLALDWDVTTRIPDRADFIFHVKDHAAHDRGPKGYYAEVTMTNNSTEDAELYAVSSEISESSK